MVELTVNQTKEFIRQSIKNKDSRAIFLWGEGGIGKTSLIYQVSQELGIYLVDKKLSQENPVTAVGLFYPEIQRKMTLRLPRIYLQTAIQRDNQGLPTIMFFDELINAHPDVISAIWELINERMIEGYRFRNLYLISASNEIDENISMINPAFWSRFSHIKVVPSLNEFLVYISKICSHVPTFLKLNPGLLFVKGSKFGIRANPRSWEWVARHCCEFKYDDKVREQKIKSDIDVFDGEISKQFLIFREKLSEFKFFPIEDYIKNPKNLPPDKNLSQLLFIIFSIPRLDVKNYVRELRNFVSYLVRNYPVEITEILFNLLKPVFENSEGKMLSVFETYFKEIYDGGWEFSHESKQYKAR